jgi:hypothetical protein
MTGIACPECHAPSEVLATRRHSSGTIRRRHQCRTCRHRWTSYEGDPPGHRGGWPAGRSAKPWRQLSPEQVRHILESPLSDRQLALEVGRSRWAIAQLRSGRTYANLWPELPRRQAGLTCLQCSHWRNGRCGMGFPDPVEEGLGFANDCSMYAEER